MSKGNLASQASPDDLQTSYYSLCDFQPFILYNICVDLLFVSPRQVSQPTALVPALPLFLFPTPPNDGWRERCASKTMRTERTSDRRQLYILGCANFRTRVSKWQIGYCILIFLLVLGYEPKLILPRDASAGDFSDVRGPKIPKICPPMFHTKIVHTSGTFFEHFWKNVNKSF